MLSRRASPTFMLPYSVYLLGPPVLRNLLFSPPTAAQQLSESAGARGFGNSSGSHPLHFCSAWTSATPWAGAVLECSWTVVT